MVILFSLKGHNTQHSGHMGQLQLVVIWVNFYQTELMVEIHSKSLVRAIGKVLPMKFS